MRTSVSTETSGLVSEISAALKYRALARAMHSAGKMVQAAALFEGALAIFEGRTNAQCDEYIVSTLNQLALAKKGLAELDVARRLLERALEISETRLGSHHPLEATTVHNLAVVLKAQGYFIDAQPFAERALNICKAIYGETHCDTAAALNNLAIVMHANGDFGLAKILADKALAILLAKGDAQSLAFGLNLVAVMMREEGNLMDARKYCDRAFALSRKALGLRHIDTAMIMSNLGLILQRLGDLSGARMQSEEALGIYQEFLVPNHPAIADGLWSLAGVVEEQGESQLATSLLARALAIRETTLGLQHPDTIAVTVALNAPELWRARRSSDEPRH